MSSRARDQAADEVVLRAVGPGDARQLYDWRMEPATRAMFGTTAEVPFAVHEAVLARHLAAGGRDLWFVIERCGQPVGTISLYGWSADGRRAEWGRFVIEPALRGRGLGRAALERLLRVAGDLGAERLTCSVLASNQIARRLYADLGFVQVGIRVGDDGRELLLLECSLTDPQPQSRPRSHLD